MKIYNHLVSLYNNPFVYSPVFTTFFSEMPSKKHGMLLAPLVLPLVLYPDSKLFLTNATKASSLRTFLEEKTRIAGVNQRIVDYQRVGNLSLQYLYDRQKITITKDVGVEVVENVKPVLLDLTKPATMLAYFFAPYEVPVVFRMLGVKKYGI